jgi:hypothetical protein
MHNSRSVDAADAADLNVGLGSTLGYVVDVENRMMRWVDAPRLVVREGRLGGRK